MDSICSREQKRAPKFSLYGQKNNFCCQSRTSVAEITMENKENVLEFELCSFPPALFDSSGLPLEARKPALRDALCSYYKGVGEVDGLPAGNYYFVIDGGSLLQRIPWIRGTSISDIIAQYCKHVTSKYGSAYVVFDGYSASLSTKDTTHMRRNGGAGIKINFDLKSTLHTCKELFLANKNNKQRFIHFLSQTSGHITKHAVHGPDVDIVMTAFELSTEQETVVIEDTDLLCLMCAHFQSSYKNVYFTSAKQEGKVYCIRSLSASLGSNAPRLLFAHALLGCDTTSRVYGIGKSVALKKLQSEEFQKIADIFLLVPHKKTV